MTGADIEEEGTPDWYREKARQAEYKRKNERQKNAVDVFSAQLTSFLKMPKKNIDQKVVKNMIQKFIDDLNL